MNPTKQEFHNRDNGRHPPFTTVLRGVSVTEYKLSSAVWLRVWRCGLKVNITSIKAKTLFWQLTGLWSNPKSIEVWMHGNASFINYLVSAQNKTGLWKQNKLLLRTLACLMEPLQKSSWLNGGCLRGDFDLYLLSPVTPWKLGSRCCRVKLSLKWLSALVSPPQLSQTILDLFICAWGMFGSAAVSTPTLPLVFQPPRRQMWDQNCSATLNYICWQSSSLTAGWWGPVSML